MLTIGYWALLSVVVVERQRQGFEQGETYCVDVSFSLQILGLEWSRPGFWLSHSDWR